MADTYELKFSEGASSVFWHRVAVALEIKAKTQFDAGLGGANDREKRLVQQVLSDPRSLAQQAALMIASNSGVDSGSADTAISTAVDAVWDFLSWLFETI